jgi:IS30 family transposase
MVGLFRQYSGVREEISRGLASDSSIREIAKCLERAVSTVSREVARHGGRPAYRASQADGEAWQSALRPKRCLLSSHLKLRDIVASKLMLDWSPKQISGWLKTQYPDDESMRVSHETIYRSLFIQARGALKEDTSRIIGAARPASSSGIRCSHATPLSDADHSIASRTRENFARGFSNGKQGEGRAGISGGRSRLCRVLHLADLRQQVRVPADPSTKGMGSSPGRT